MCIRDSLQRVQICRQGHDDMLRRDEGCTVDGTLARPDIDPVSYTHLRAHETVLDLVCRLLLEKKK